MGLKDLLKRKDEVEEERQTAPDTSPGLSAPEFTFIRSDTFSQEVIHPPGHQDGGNDDDQHLSTNEKETTPSKHRLSLASFRSPRSRHSSVSSTKSTAKEKDHSLQRESTTRRLSHRLHLSRSPSSSEVVPANLPEIVTTPEDKDGAEQQWERRATILARENGKHRERPAISSERYSFEAGGEFAQLKIHDDDGQISPGPHDIGVAYSTPEEKGPEVVPQRVVPEEGVVSTKAIDEDIQTAIKLHEEGDLKRSTAMFGRLADPKGANNPLSQVLYGLALRHGWGCDPDPAAAVNYLSAAASNAATVENLALQAGLKKGGAAKGELVLAIFELANCFRHGWGIPKDAVAAKQYYETAANLGDTDAMNEVAWCYLEGFGTKKDKCDV
ncbi:hypothetical protein DL546_008048 [Coniochaeta pulveracea]|uniref:Uncharacterized protein n=1 Tax=Coniochaeta pulveracea TaxID=177199 RepID=A0A420YFM2_9PEZI|nr:hypothetical protein DL546_008048 [Coniochaeta pulveracea]